MLANVIETLADWKVGGMNLVRTYKAGQERGKEMDSTDG